MKLRYATVLIIGILSVSYVGIGRSSDQFTISSLFSTDSAGKKGVVATESVFKIEIIHSKHSKTGPCSSGTGFLHSSGGVLTAAHVVSGAAPKEVFIALKDGSKVPVKKMICNDDLDIAFLYPEETIKGRTLSLSTAKSFTIGNQVSTWGFPSGYNGRSPMLSVGYLSAIDKVKRPSGKVLERLVVNAAFNSGNSGGPLIDIKSGKVIGIVVTKVSPMPPRIKKLLAALDSQKAGPVFTETRSDGTKKQMSEAQVIEDVLQHLRKQVQLVIGRAVLVGHIRSFLVRNKITP